jgi:hypothetical protein
MLTNASCGAPRLKTSSPPCLLSNGLCGVYDPASSPKHNSREPYSHVETRSYMPAATPSSTVIPARNRADPASFLGRMQELAQVRRRVYFRRLGLSRPLRQFDGRSGAPARRPLGAASRFVARDAMGAGQSWGALSCSVHVASFRRVFHPMRVESAHTTPPQCLCLRLQRGRGPGWPPLIPILCVRRCCVSGARFRFACPVTSGRCCLGLLAPARPAPAFLQPQGPGRTWPAGEREALAVVS